MFGPIHVATDDRLLGLTQKCPDCGRQIYSNGKMYYEDDSAVEWSIGYWCPYDKEMIRIWTPNDKPLLDEVTKDIDISSLPILGAPPG